MNQTTSDMSCKKSHGTILSLVNLSIEQFKNDYHLKSTDIVSLSFTNSISLSLGAIFITFYGSKGNKPRWLAFSAVLVGVEALLYCWPYISGRNYQMKREIEDMCQEMKAIDICRDTVKSSRSNYMFFYTLGKIVQGIIASPVFLLSKIYVDDSAKGYSIGTYIGFGEASALFGYAFGTILGTPQIQTFMINNTAIKKTELPYWLVTWWIDFLLPGVIAWSIVIPLLCFPPTLPGTAEVKAEKRKQSDWAVNNAEDQDLGTSIKDLFTSISILMKNPVFIMISLSRAVEFFLVPGFALFLPKYLENQYKLTVKMASTISGFVLVPGNAVGHLLGGVIISKLEMSCKAVMRFIIASSIVAIILVVFTMFIRCEAVEFAGITENYEGTGQLGNLTAPCNSRCGCSSSFYFPICGRDNVEYFSPCFAGCGHKRILKNKQLYYNCSCITKGLSIQNNEDSFNDAVLGNCEAKCYQLPLFISFLFSVIVFSALSIVPSIVTLLRCSKKRTLELQPLDLQAGM
ncbi:PREDICTED: solute carrier organic anion transporter family member 6A1 [Elephantulus edwardii]|uniref:solute carrier organic anion transporter family member 6A1 n=1 Tax=Elephantulus edwardii TaxID=28737 RepID=UPI0003F05FDF|nr:PREDICTED: solute carrier organic anion transporter family member 6A1 [Elephantulus edwardii]